MSFIVPVIQHGRQDLCYLNLSEMVANHLLVDMFFFIFNGNLVEFMTSTPH